MLNSERKEWSEKLKKALDEQSNIKYSVLTYLTGVVNRAEYLSTEQKEQLVKEFWRDEDNE